MILGLFARKKVLLLEIGNYMVSASLLELTRGRYRVISYSSGSHNQAIKNGIIQDRKHFTRSILDVIEKLTIKNWSDVLVGFDSTYVRYNGFDFDTKVNNSNALLDKISHLLPESKILHYQIDGSKISTISIHRNILDKLYSALDSIDLTVTEFLSMKYLYGSYINQAKPNKSKIQIIVNIGYNSTNISTFHNNFLLNYRTYGLGLRNIAVALAHQCNLLPDDIYQLLGAMSLFEDDGRDWITCQNRDFNKKHISSLLNLYTRALVKKLLGDDYTYVNSAILCGWASKMIGIDEIFRQFVPSAIVIKDYDSIKLQPYVIHNFV